MRRHFLVLPQELLAEILKQLEVKDLLRCRQVCTALRDIIKDSLQLQYHIELAADGLVNGVDCSMSTADRLKLLLDRRRRWNHLEWTKIKSIVVSGQCHAYELVNDTLGISKGVLGSRHLSLTTLPTSSRPAQMVERDDVGLNTRDFAMDPSQDLVAFVEFELVGKVTIHLHTMKENKHHPMAAQHTLETSFWEQMHTISSVQIVDDIVGVFCSAHGPALAIWNWHTGEQLVKCADTELPSGTYDIAFLSSRAYMVTVASGSGTIELYTFSGTRASNAGDRNLPIHVAQLGLPPTRPGKDLRQFKTHTAPFVSKQTPGKPFETSRDSRIHVMELWYGDRAQKFNMFVHNSFLLSLIGMPRGQSDTEQLVNTKLWDEWGPNHTRFHAYVTPFQWLRYVHGSRFIFPPVLLDAAGDPILLMLIDFNVHPGRQGEDDDDPEGNPTILDPHTMITTYDSEIEPRDYDYVFEKTVVTRLPYRRTTRCRFPQLDIMAYTGVMIGEDRLLGFKSTPNENSDIAVDVFIF